MNITHNKVLWLERRIVTSFVNRAGQLFNYNEGSRFRQVKPLNRRTKSGRHRFALTSAGRKRSQFPNGFILHRIHLDIRLLNVLLLAYICLVIKKIGNNEHSHSE